jgi:hypothetical protein
MLQGENPKVTVCEKPVILDDLYTLKDVKAYSSERCGGIRSGRKNTGTAKRSLASSSERICVT